MSGVLHGVASVARPSGPYLLNTNTYSQSSVYSGNNAATWEYMNNNNADGSVNDKQTGTILGNSWIKTSLGSEMFVDHIVIGYDYLHNLPGGWGDAYTYNADVQGSTNDSTWTTITTTPGWDSDLMPDGLWAIPIEGSWSHIRLYRNVADYLCTLEFQIWVT